MTMSSIRTIGAGVMAVCWVAALPAQQVLPDGPNQATVKHQVKNFEAALKNAVDLGGQQVAEKARKIYPEIALVQSFEPVAKGWAQPQFGLVFEVEIPEIYNAGIWVLGARTRELQNRVVPVVPVPPNSTTSPPGPTRVSGSTVQQPDPVTTSSVIPFFDPDKEYRDCVYEALIDALLENSGALPLEGTDWLSVVASSTRSALPDPLKPDSRKLILMINGSDLSLYRKKELTKEQIRQKILESRF
jgi:hypothetical protein